MLAQQAANDGGEFSYVVIASDCSRRCHVARRLTRPRRCADCHRTRRSVATDDRERRTDVNGDTFVHQNCREDPARLCGNLGVDLVGRDFEQWLPAGNCVADFFEPLGHGPIGNGFTQLRHGDVSHCPSAQLSEYVRKLTLVGTHREMIGHPICTKWSMTIDHIGATVITFFEQ